MPSVISVIWQQIKTREMMCRRDGCGASDIKFIFDFAMGVLSGISLFAGLLSGEPVTTYFKLFFILMLAMTFIFVLRKMTGFF